MTINEAILGYLVTRKEAKFDLSNTTIGILGMAVKGNEHDTRNSIAYRLRKLLIFMCKLALISDPLVKDSRLASKHDLINKADLLIKGAPQDQDKTLITDEPKIDIWNILGDGVLI